MESKQASTKKEKTADEILESILQYEKQHHGIDWKEAVKNNVDYIKAMDKSYDRLEKKKANMDEAEIQSGINAGFLNEQGNVKRIYYDIGKKAMASPAANSDVLTTTGDKSHPVVAFLTSHMKGYKDLSGNRIKQVEMGLINNINTWANLDQKDELKNALISDSCIGVGILIQNVIKACRSEVSEISVELLTDVLGDSIAAVGMNVVTGLLGVLALALIPFLAVADKEEKGTMLIINSTSEKLALVGEDIVHGKVISTFRGSENELATTMEQEIGPNCFGFICFSKREGAYYGTQGALQFEKTENRKHGAWIGWEVPITGDNRVWVSLNHVGTTGEIAYDVDESGKQEDSSQRGSQTVTGRVDSSSGGEAFFLCYFSED